MSLPYIVGKGRLYSALQLMSSNERLIRDTHGNVSLFDRAQGHVYIKPSGVPYGDIEIDDVCVVDDSTLRQYSSRRRPSVDLPHHISIYHRHPWIRAICHTHSPYVVAHAIAGRDIRCLSTEQADYFGGPVNVLPYADLNDWGDQVSVSGSTRAVLLERHGALTFAADPVEAVKLAVALENVAEKNYLAWVLGGQVEPLPDRSIDQWHRRYRDGYGQG